MQVRARDAAGNVSTPVLSLTVNLLQNPQFTIAIVNKANTVQASVTIPRVIVSKLSDGTLILNLASQATDSSGNLKIQSASLTAGTDYVVTGWNADGSKAFVYKGTAA